ncbi:alpha/beta hydrolase [Roseateles violae]|uniref:Acyl-CoA:diacylglycerol acyltransferase n=1 Tax=Roseateles violae TaxID=3058042 RepID=A0ABT8DTK6_9BURK|nr:alpha/beta hydrolase-fold protein [Pelomonas sp. PFR6]MDN3921333.1 alpha/beta hydrolase-fold protein [Pelomonas sp. PFR6]
MKEGRRALLGLLAGAAGLAGFGGCAAPAQAAAGTLTEHHFPSALLGGDWRYQLYLPAGYAEGHRAYPVLYLLHGRGDDLRAWTRCKPLLDELIAAGLIPPLIAVMPDAPWSARGSYYVDSAYSGVERPGRAVETAFIGELLPHIDASYRTDARREARLLAGYSMGGYGALRHVLAHPQLFGAAIVLSPAVYTPLPPRASSAREFGAFGRDQDLFVDEIYRALNYPALLERFSASGLGLRFYICSGDDEYRNPDPAEAEHDIDLEAHRLYKRLARLPNIQAELRIVDGGHDWRVWLPALREGLLMLAPGLVAGR